MSRVKGKIQNLRAMSAKIEKLGDVQQQARIAAQCATALTAEVQVQFAAHETVYSQGREAGKFSHKPHEGTHTPQIKGGHRSPVMGAAVDLLQSGRTVAALAFTSTGSILRAVLGTKYAKYLIGRYKIMPIGSSALPASWQAIMHWIVGKALREAVGK